MARAEPACATSATANWRSCSVGSGPGRGSGAETEPAHLWQRLLQNQRGSVVAHAVRRDTEAVICRLRFRLTADAR
ncbi:hypothetical protein [Streptomyces sp. NRRL S-87]|uniref:hypothetical protein n=1 Tax=Streptomyces sp. NRRL S-87 TaxID=1463920 RepID=UPI0004BF4E79|nr:hypothetical protein [Streptomyces sp. NRRL S-87]